jgi:hypothetical protein
MKTHGLRAACSAAFFMAVALVTLSMAGSTPAAAVECTGPFAQCAIAVGGKCEIENGRMKMIFYDKGGYSNSFEDCVGKVYEAHGKPNPYKPASSQKPAPKR